jgi:hypothetical protein
VSTAAAKKLIPKRPATTRHIGYRLPESAGAIRRAWHRHGLSIALVTLFAATMVGQIWAGWFTYN